MEKRKEKLKVWREEERGEGESSTHSSTEAAQGGGWLKRERRELGD